mmetsp:Transcript_16771/g.38740  ORF Transcript_16771/g.38740 Transcript_16771/m.38740 type:complete len:319 (-) Transcript_16771:1006-1962(-)
MWLCIEVAEGVSDNVLIQFEAHNFFQRGVLQHFVQNHAIASSHKQDALNCFDESSRKVYDKFMIVWSISRALLNRTIKSHNHIFGPGMLKKLNCLVLRVKSLQVTRRFVIFPFRDVFVVTHSVSFFRLTVSPRVVIDVEVVDRFVRQVLVIAPDWAPWWPVGSSFYFLVTTGTIVWLQKITRLFVVQIFVSIANLLNGQLHGHDEIAVIRHGRVPLPLGHGALEFGFDRHVLDAHEAVDFLVEEALDLAFDVPTRFVIFVDFEFDHEIVFLLVPVERNIDLGCDEFIFNIKGKYFREVIGIDDSEVTEVLRCRRPRVR